MKVVILAGGLGTRMGNESKNKPKPMTNIGNMPIICHIMNRYAYFGLSDFVICAGHKGNVLKDFFKNSFNPEPMEKKFNVKFNVKVVDTGKSTMTGGRLKRVERFLDDETFCFTYGDTLNDLNIKKSILYHKKQKTFATVTACKPNENFGILILNHSKVTQFKEKPIKENWVNGGYFILEPKVFDYINNDETVWEKEPMQKLVKKKQLSAFRHTGFYQPMDTINERDYLEKLLKEKKAPWKV